MSTVRQHRVARLCQPLLAAILALALTLAVPLSAHALGELRDHNCAGERCAACQVMATARAVLRGRAPLGAASSASRLAFAQVGAASLARLAARGAQTPVTLRVMLLI